MGESLPNCKERSQQIQIHHYIPVYESEKTHYRYQPYFEAILSYMCSAVNRKIHVFGIINIMSELKADIRSVSHFVLSSLRSASADAYGKSAICL